jgi:hypothetical protein
MRPSYIIRNTIQKKVFNEIAWNLPVTSFPFRYLLSPNSSEVVFIEGNALLNSYSFLYILTSSNPPTFLPLNGFRKKESCDSKPKDYHIYAFFHRFSLVNEMTFYIPYSCRRNLYDYSYSLSTYKVDQ